jgi:hypothetical protein
LPLSFPPDTQMGGSAFVADTFKAGDRTAMLVLGPSIP